MGQRAAWAQLRKFFAAVLLAVVVASCERSASTQPRPSAARPTVASLVPTATDMILEMSAGAHLIAVSNWDASRAEIDHLPRVGDYRSIDWERITQLRPDLLIVQFRPDKMPAGLEDRTRELGIKLVNIKNNTLADIFDTLDQLGDAIDEREKSHAAATALKAQLDEVKARVGGKPPVRTLITRSESSRLACVGGGNYLDDVLAIAGGSNVLGEGENSYPEIDRERLLKLNPDAVLVLLPGATPQVVKQAEEFWRSVPQVSAVQNNRVHILTDSYALLGSLSLGKLTERFADLLHPQ
jgi:iron complex transport system substrate-binding protein